MKKYQCELRKNGEGYIESLYKDVGYNGGITLHIYKDWEILEFHLVGRDGSISTISYNLSSFSILTSMGDMLEEMKNIRRDNVGPLVNIYACGWWEHQTSSKNVVSIEFDSLLACLST